MASFNNCTFSGNVGRDPEVRYFDDGKMVANFSIAIEGRRGGQAFWMTIKVWNKPAQVIADYVRKGSRLIVSGDLQEETWEKEGQQKSKMILNCQNFTLLDGKKDANGTGNNGNAGNATKRAPRPQSRPQAADPIDDEIPF